MKNYNKIQIKLKKEIEKDLYSLESAMDINGCIDLYFNVLNYEYNNQTVYDLGGLAEKIENTLQKFFIEEKSEKITLFQFSDTFETFVKKIYHVLFDGGFIDVNNSFENELYTVGKYTGVLNRIKKKYKDKNGNDTEEEFSFKKTLATKNGIQQYFKYFPNFEEYKNLESEELKTKITKENLPLYYIYLIPTYNNKNTTSHQEPNLSVSDAISAFRNCLIVQIHLIHFFRQELKETLIKQSFLKEDFNFYLNKLQSKYDNNINRYVPLNLFEIRNDTIEPNQGLIEKIFDTEHRIRILAQAGCGKTTSLEYLTSFFYDKYRNGVESRIPVLIYLGNLIQDQTLISAIAQEINKSVEKTEELIKQNRLILFLDGLNEINTSLNHQKKIKNEISELESSNQDLSICVTDRFENDIFLANYFDGLKTFEIVKLAPFQIDQFINKYVVNQELEIKVRDILNQNKKISHLFEKPLFLTRALQIINAKHSLPEGEGELIGDFIDLILLREKNDKADPKLNIRTFKLAFSFLANCIYQFQVSKNTTQVSNLPLHEYKIKSYLRDGLEFFCSEYASDPGYSGYLVRIALELEIVVIHNDFIKFFHDNYFSYFHSEYIVLETQIN
jgi:hypothetical protein